MFVELLNELHVRNLAFIRDVHYWVPVVHIQDSHRNAPVYLVEDQEHDPVANFEFVQVVVLEHVQQRVVFDVPHTERPLHSVPRHYFAVQVVELDEVGELQHVLLKDLVAFDLSLLEVAQRN